MSKIKEEIILMPLRSVKTLVLAILIIISSVSCIDNDSLECEEATLIGTDITSLLVSDNSCTLRKRVEQDEVIFKIQSQQKLEEWLDCEISLPLIDYSQQFIVGGRVKSYECGLLEGLSSEVGCNKIKLTITIQPLICAAITDVYFFTALPIAYVNNEVEYEIINL